MKEHKTELCNIHWRAIHTTIKFDVYVICLLTCSVLSENEQTHHNQMWMNINLKSFFSSYSSSQADRHTAWNGSGLCLRTWVLSHSLDLYNVVYSFYLLFHDIVSFNHVSTLSQQFGCSFLNWYTQE